MQFCEKKSVGSPFLNWKPCGGSLLSNLKNVNLGMCVYRVGKSRIQQKCLITIQRTTMVIRDKRAFTEFNSLDLLRVEDALPMAEITKKISINKAKRKTYSIVLKYKNTFRYIEFMNKQSAIKWNGVAMAISCWKNNSKRSQLLQEPIEKPEIWKSRTIEKIFNLFETPKSHQVTGERIFDFEKLSDNTTKSEPTDSKNEELAICNVCKKPYDSTTSAQRVLDSETMNENNSKSERTVMKNLQLATPEMFKSITEQLKRITIKEADDPTEMKNAELLESKEQIEKDPVPFNVARERLQKFFEKNYTRLP